MIKGDLRFTSNNPGSLPVWCALPWIDAEIEIPSLKIKRTVTFLADSGADGTVLNLRDSLAMLGKQGYRLLRQSGRTRTSIGVGGSARYFTVPARIILQHDNGRLEQYSLELAIAKPARKGSKKLGIQLRIPSLLGRDILCQFRMVMDYSKHELFLDH
jgi:hypothetical protein